MSDLASQLAPPDTMLLLSEWRKFTEATLSIRTVDNYWRVALRFFLVHPIPLVDITEEQIIEFITRYPPHSSSAVLSYYGLRHLFRWAKRRHHIIFDPLEHVPAPTIKEKVPVALSDEELARLIQSASLRHPLRGFAVCLLYLTGARIHEAITMRWDDVIVDNLRIREGKGNKERYVPLTGKLLTTLQGLRTYTNDDERILPRSSQCVWTWVSEAGRDAGLKRAHPHLLRATFATTLLNRGAKVHTVQNLLGHVNLKTTVRYLAVTDTDRRVAVDLL